MYIIRNTQGKICGVCTNRPGARNLLPDGRPEQVEFVEDESEQLDAAGVAKRTSQRAEISAFRVAQEAKFALAEMRASAQQAVLKQQLAAMLQDPAAPQEVRDYARELAR